jgi:hypothetical protein
MPTSAAPHRPRSARPIPLITGASLALVLAACESSPSTADGCARPLRLEVGEAADVQPGPECPLRAEGGAEYVLAFYDARLAMGAQTEPEPYNGIDDRFLVIAQDVTGGARTALASVAPAQFAALPRTADFQVSFPSSGAAQVVGIPGTGPWSVGDQIPRNRPQCGADCTPYTEARVARVIDDWLVLAVDPSLGADTERVLSLFDQAVPLLRQHGLPLLHAAFTAERPVTTAASEQLVMIFEADVSAVDGNAYSEVRAEGTATHWIRLEHSADLDLGEMLSLLSHELAHTFQFEFMARIRPLVGSPSSRGAALWGIEGGAALAETETLRRAVGLPLQGNVDYGATPASQVESWLFGIAAARSGALPVGYHETAPFLRDLALRRIGRGEPVDVAFREVLRGAVEGWYGVALDGTRRPGLVERMRTRLPGWEPADAVLTWALSSAADDRIAHPAYQDPTWLRTGDWESRGRGWEHDALVQAGSGASARFSVMVGASGYLLVRSPASVVELMLTAPETVRWRLLRVS